MNASFSIEYVGIICVILFRLEFSSFIYFVASCLAVSIK